MARVLLQKGDVVRRTLLGTRFHSSDVGDVGVVTAADHSTVTITPFNPDRSIQQWHNRTVYWEKVDG